MLRVSSSRRAAGLKPGDFDHEIITVDREDSEQASDFDRVDTSSRLLPTHEERDGEEEQSSTAPEHADHEEQLNDEARLEERPAEELQHEQELPHEALRPSIEVQEATPQLFNEHDSNVKPKTPRVEREAAIDILYENERGGFLCGAALFSSRALGGLDPAPWTNAHHKPSPTSIHTAQVPDPTWEWAWPEWHVNLQDELDESGWEYSFAFSKSFSWHKSKWWNSFVRRRAWTRKRVRKKEEEMSDDPHMLNSHYFSVRPASERIKRSQASLASSGVRSKASWSHVSSVEIDDEDVDIEDIEMLIFVLRRARIDREKLEAVENYIEHANDLGQLQEEMHDVMSLFVFQASRRILLGRLMQICDDVTKQLENRDTSELRSRQEALGAAARHADEEVRKLAYWSDVRKMAQDGETRGAVDGDKGWHEMQWQGVDQSGPTEPNSGKLPGAAPS